MTVETWIAAIGALGGGAGIAELVRRVRGSEGRPSVPPPAHATRDELMRLQGQLDDLKTAVEEVEDRLRDRIDTNVREIVERVHAIALKTEGVIASLHILDDVRPSRRGGR